MVNWCAGMLAHTFLTLFVLIQGLRALPLSCTCIQPSTEIPATEIHSRLSAINATQDIQPAIISQSNDSIKSVQAVVHKIRVASSGYPNRNVGHRLRSWQPGHGMAHPEELGSYVQGDILQPPGHGFRNGLKETKFRWTKGIIPFVIEGDFNEKQLGKIRHAMEEYHKHTCIRFVEHSDQEDFVTIKSGDTGCWSSLGRVGGMQTVNFQTPMCLYYTGTVIHELMHAIGFFHEQSRTDRDEFIAIDWENVITGQEYNFNKFESLTFGKDYDYSSVMHYSSVAFSKNTKPSILPKINGVTIGQRKRLSEIDIDKINTMYKCSDGESHVI